MFDYKTPDLSEFNASSKEIELACKYTKITTIGGFYAWFAVDHQYFCITKCDCEDEKQANWYCWQFAKALLKCEGL